MTTIKKAYEYRQRNREQRYIKAFILVNKLKEQVDLLVKEKVRAFVTNPKADIESLNSQLRLAQGVYTQVNKLHDLVSLVIDYDDTVNFSANGAFTAEIAKIESTLKNLVSQYQATV